MGQSVRNTMPQDRQFGAVLKAMRRDRQLRQRQLAVLIGVTASHLSRVESGKRRPPSGPALDRMIQELGLDDGDAAARDLRLLATQRPYSLALPRGFSEIDRRAIVRLVALWEKFEPPTRRDVAELLECVTDSRPE